MAHDDAAVVKFVAKNAKNGKRLLGFGLSRENCARLLLGQPIPVDLAEMGVEGLEMVIFAGETEAALEAELRQHGLIDDATHVHHAFPDER